ncbi:MAG: hypothetical protein ILP19_00280 [Oscillospiraceae bacterium]|nr:hypothetical protein [Oscillospiraceae bacterium]
MADKNNPKKKRKNLFDSLAGAEEKLFSSDRSLRVLSILLGIILWILISVSQFPDSEYTIETVPIVIDLDGSLAEDNSLIAVDKSVQTVDVKVKGKRTQIGSLKSTDLIAYTDLDTVIAPRTYDLKMDIRTANNTDTREFEVMSITPSTVKVTFDKMISKELELVPEIYGMRAAPGNVVMEDDITISPKTVTITGPQETIGKITKAAVKVKFNSELSSTYEGVSSDLNFYNESAPVDLKNAAITVDKEQFKVNIPVYYRNSLPLKVTISNAPANFDTNYFSEQLVYSLDTIEIASPDSSIMALESIDIGSINMKEVQIGSTFDFSTEQFLPENCRNLSNVSTIRVTCPSEGIATKPIVLRGKDIVYLNRPAGFEYSSTTSGLTLYIFGDEEQIQSFSSEDITAQIDLLNIEKEEGEYLMPLDFNISSSYNRVWFTGGDNVSTPKIYVKATAIIEMTTAPDEDPET